MTYVLPAAQFFLLAALVFLALGSLAAAAIARVGATRIASLEPHTRYRALALLAGLPLIIVFALLLSACLPSLVSLAVPAWDHCLTHDDRHAHLCFVHLPHLHVNLPVILSLVFLLSYATLRAVLSFAGMLRAARVLRALTRTGEARGDLGATLLETPEPICLTAGLMQPSVLISRGLLELLDAEERAIVLAHEREHVRRRDALTATFVRACAALHVPGVGRWIVRESEIAAEQICDEKAGRAVGDRAAVAAALLTVERAASRNQFGALALGAGTSAIARRVEALLADPIAPSSLRSTYVALTVFVIAALAAAQAIHHATESLLSLIAR